MRRECYLDTKVVMAGSSSGDFDVGDLFTGVTAGDSSSDQTRSPTFMHPPAPPLTQTLPDGRVIPVVGAGQPRTMLVGAQSPEGEGFSPMWTSMAAFSQSMNIVPLHEGAGNTQDRSNPDAQADIGPRDIMEAVGGGGTRLPVVGTTNATVSVGPNIGRVPHDQATSGVDNVQSTSVPDCGVF